MSKDHTRKITITGALGAIAVLLGWTHWGFIPWFGGISLTIMHVPVIIGAVLEGPLVGAVIGLIFGAFSMLQAAVAPTSPSDVWFTNPLLAILPRLFIGPLAWLAWRALKRWPAPALIISGIVGSMANTLLVLGTIGLLGYLPWAALPPVILSNGLLEAAASAVITLAVVAAWKRIEVGKQQGSKI
ncbi:MAG TPA: ECF transporter S component [Anaerolineae bacterium]|nr:ECF transporter S component [Anaerolineae bacterium]HQH39076.1 ECF transporter S component [Anaerolineae bacterium]